MLYSSVLFSPTLIVEHILESVELVLPSAVQLDSHLDTPEDHLFAALEIYSELHDIAISHDKSLTLLTRRTQADVVQECARGALHILDVPLSVLVPEFAMSSADHLALEANRGCRGLVPGCIVRSLAISLRITTYTDRLGARGQGATDGGECERGALRSWIVISAEAY